HQTWAWLSAYEIGPCCIWPSPRACACRNWWVCASIRSISRPCPACASSVRAGERVLPLWKETATIIKAWLKVRPASSAPELFLNARAQAMTRSGFEYVLKKHVATAARTTTSLVVKNVSPHILRHTCAMHTLQATRDVRKVSLWLGHASLQSTEVYLRADPTEKLDALAAMAPPILKPG